MIKVRSGLKWLATIVVAFSAMSSFGQQLPTDYSGANVTLSTPEPATPDAPSALKFANQNQLDTERRITAEDKFHIFLASSVSTETLSEAAINTRLMDDWKSGQFNTTPGYWTRYRTELATSESRALLSKY